MRLLKSLGQISACCYAVAEVFGLVLECCYAVAEVFGLVFRMLLCGC